MIAHQAGDAYHAYRMARPRSICSSHATQVSSTHTCVLLYAEDERVQGRLW